MNGSPVSRICKILSLIIWALTMWPRIRGRTSLKDTGDGSLVGAGPAMSCEATLTKTKNCIGLNIGSWIGLMALSCCCPRRTRRGVRCRKCFPHSDDFNEVPYSIIVGVPGSPGRQSCFVLGLHQRLPTDLGSYLYIKNP